jgi:hypothetical protein
MRKLFPDLFLIGYSLMLILEALTFLLVWHHARSGRDQLK